MSTLLQLASAPLRSYVTHLLQTQLSQYLVGIELEGACQTR